MLTAPIALLPSSLWALPSTASTNLSAPANVIIPSAIINPITLTGYQSITAPDKTVLKWTEFGSVAQPINNGDVIEFNLPSATSGILNMVTGSSVSTINGTLKSNGNIFVLNTQGIVVGATGVINAAGVTLSTAPEPSDLYFVANGSLSYAGTANAGITIDKGAKINTIGSTGNVMIASKGANVSGTIDAGKLEINSQGAAAVNLAVGGSLVLGTDGSKTVDGVVTDGIGELIVKTNGGALTLGDASNGSVLVKGGKATLETANGAVTLNGTGTFRVNDTQNTKTLVINAGTGAVSLGNSVDGANGIPALAGGMGSGKLDTANITINAGATNLGIYATVASGTNDVSIKSGSTVAGNLVVYNQKDKGSLSVTADVTGVGSTISLSSPTEDKNVSFTGAGDLTFRYLGTHAKDDTTVSVTSTTGSVTLPDFGKAASSIGAGDNTNANLSVKAATSISQTAGTTIATRNTVTMQATAGSITLGNATNKIDKVVLKEAPLGAVVVATSNNTTQVSVNNGTNVLGAADITGNTVRLGGGANDGVVFGSTLKITANGVAATDAGIIDATNKASVYGALTLSSAKDINLDGNADNGIALESRYGQINITSAVNAKVYEAATLNLGAISTTGDLVAVSTGGDVINTGQLKIAGNATFGAGTEFAPGNINVDFSGAAGSGNQIGTGVTIAAGGKTLNVATTLNADSTLGGALLVPATGTVNVGSGLATVAAVMPLAIDQTVSGTTTLGGALTVGVNTVKLSGTTTLGGAMTLVVNQPLASTLTLKGAMAPVAGQTLASTLTLGAAVTLPAGGLTLGGDLTIPTGGMTTTAAWTTSAAFTAPTGGMTIGAATFAAGANVPAGTVIPVGTLIPSGTTLKSGEIITAGNILPVSTQIKTGTALPAALTIPADSTIASGTTLVAGTVIPATSTIGSGTIVAATNVIPAATTLGSGTIVYNGNTLPAGTVLGSGTAIASGNTIPAGSVLGLGTVIPETSVLPAATTLKDSKIYIMDSVSLVTKTNPAEATTRGALLANNVNIVNETDINTGVLKNAYGTGVVGNLTLKSLNAGADVRLVHDTAVGGELNITAPDQVMATNRGGNVIKTVTVTAGGNVDVGSSVAMDVNANLVQNVAGNTAAFRSNDALNLGTYVSNYTGMTTFNAGTSSNRKAITDGKDGIQIFGDVTFASQGAVTINNKGHAFGGVTVSTGGDNSATVTEAGSLRVVSASVGKGSLTLTSSAGDIIQSGKITVNVNSSASNTLSVNAPAGAVNLTAVDNAVDNGVAINLTALNDSSISQKNKDILLGNVTVTGGKFTADLSTNSTTNGYRILQKSGTKLNVYGDVTFAGLNGDIILENAGNRMGGILANSGTGSISITEDTTLNVKRAIAGGTLKLTSTKGDIISTVDSTVVGGNFVTATGATTLTSTAGSVNVNLPGTDFMGDLILVSKGDVTVADTVGNTVLGAGTNVGGALTVRNTAGGVLSQSGAITAAGNVLLDVGTGSIDLTNSANMLGGIRFIAGNGGVKIAEGASMNLLGGSLSTGPVTLSTAGDFFTTGPGGTSISNSADLTISATGTIKPGAGSLLVTGTFTVFSNAEKDLSALSKTGNLLGKSPVNLGTGTYKEPSP